MMLKWFLVTFSFLIFGFSLIPGVQGQTSAIKTESVDLDKETIVMPCSPGVRETQSRGNDKPVINAKVTISGDRLFRPAGSEESTTTKVDLFMERHIVDPCPKLSLSGPAGLIRPGEPAMFVAKVIGAESTDIDYKWTVDAGTIVSGQGSDSIRVDTTGLVGSTILTATVEISVESPRCSLSESEMALIVEADKAVLLDEVPTVTGNCEYILAALDSFYIKLLNHPADQGYIVIYKDPRSESAARSSERQIRNMTRLRGYDSSRTTIVTGSVRTNAVVQMWRIPPGADHPELLEPNATFEPEKPVANSGGKPFVFATMISVDMDVCLKSEPISDTIASYADTIKAMKGSRGNIVIGEPSMAKFRVKEREIIRDLSSNGIARSRVRTFFKKVRDNEYKEFVELWILP
jgi:hypothetical protein